MGRCAGSIPVAPPMSWTNSSGMPREQERMTGRLARLYRTNETHGVKPAVTIPHIG